MVHKNDDVKCFVHSQHQSSMFSCCPSTTVQGTSATPAPATLRKKIPGKNCGKVVNKNNPRSPFRVASPRFAVRRAERVAPVLRRARVRVHHRGPLVPEGEATTPKTDRAVPGHVRDAEQVRQGRAAQQQIPFSFPARARNSWTQLFSFTEKSAPTMLPTARTR